jgi:glycosyltransferase involved in cell wall biosynthesis
MKLMPDRPLRILQVCSAREVIYGAALSLRTLALAQRVAGHHVEFLGFQGKPFVGQMRDLGFPVAEVRVRAKVDPFAILRMARIMRERRIDVVHTHLSTSSVNGTLAARLAKIPSVATVHGMSGKMSFVAATRLIAVSDQVKSHLMQQGMPANRIDVVYNGLETGDVDVNADEVRTRLGLLDVGPILGTVSRVTAMKGIDTAIRTVAHLRPTFPNLRYLVVGDGDAQESCQTLAAELGVAENVIFYGYQKDVFAYLSAMDLFLFPSRKEAMGIALVEAMAVGLPTVATRVGGIPEVITPNVGLLRASEDDEGLAEACRTLLNDLPTRLEMGVQARYRARSVFGVDAMVSGTDAVYRRAMGQQTSTAERSLNPTLPSNSAASEPANHDSP